MKLVTLVFLVLSFNLFSQKTSPACEEIDGLLVESAFDISENYTGTYKICRNGIISVMGTYIDGEINGKLTAYFRTGELHYVIHKKNGISHGKEVWYWANGTKQTEGTILMDKRMAIGTAMINLET